MQLAQACPIPGDLKGKLSPLLYLTAIVLSFWWRRAALGIYVFVALI